MSEIHSIQVLIGVGENCKTSKAVLCSQNNIAVPVRTKQVFSYVPQWDDNNTLRNQMVDLQSYMKRDKLSVEEIGRARQLIEACITNRSEAYLKLQEKVIYVNQRDNQAIDSSGTKVEDRVYGGTCNVSSLAMVFKYLGYTKAELIDFLTRNGFKRDMSSMQYEDLVEYAGQYGVKSWDRYSHFSMGKLANALGFTSYQLQGSNGYLGQAWYEKNLLPELKSGHGALMSIYGHIVRIQGMNEKGLIVDDPFGVTILKKGLTQYNYAIGAANDDGTNKRYNYGGKQVEGDWNEGEDNIWNWKTLENHGTYWIRIVK